MERTGAGDLDNRDRFDRRRVIGTGGMGTVYAAVDRTTGQTVALKVLSHLGPLELYLFKNEFRSLAGVMHPNLVGLHEFFNVDDEWFFSMDLVKGVPLLAWLWGAETFAALCGEGSDTSLLQTRPGRISETGPPPERGVQRTDVDEGFASTVVGSGAAARAQARARADGPAHAPDGTPAPYDLLGPRGIDRLRSLLPQLVAGVSALHRAGKLHRDLKPSNILVSGGRAVLLDFGLVQDINPAPDGLQGHLISGTIPYMSPEQARGERLDEASDWYALGAVLYEALTGQVPHRGRMSEVLVAKTRVPPISPRELNPGLPEDLVSFCMDLLQVDPDRRPTGDELMERLGLDPESSVFDATGTGFGIGLVGRRRELSELRKALDEVRWGRQVTVQVRGRSGMGKTALVQEFLEDVDAQGGLVLSGRCYERESVPFKALDPLVDALVRHLLTLPEPDRQALIPSDIGLLGKVFQVVERLSGAPPEAIELGDPLELRRRAFAALRELLDRVTRRQPLVVHIDDLQWSDGDSLGRLRELLRPPSPPPLLLLLTVRSEQVDERPVVREFLAGEGDGAGEPSVIDVGPLATDEAVELAEHLLGVEGPGARDRAEALAREAGGVPIFIEEMVRYLRMPEAFAPGSAPLDPSALTLEEVIAHRVRLLPEESRVLMEVVAVAGQPLPQRAAWTAAGIGVQGWRAIAVLSAQKLVRTHGRDMNDPIECYHDRIRTTLVAGLPEDRLRGHHLALARVLNASGSADPERLFLHFLEGGDRGRAAVHAQAAAVLAYGALAFDRAADLFRRCAELLPEGQAARRGLDLRHADALEKAGRGPEAAEALIAAAAIRPPEEAWRLVSRAAALLLMSGHLQRGKELLHRILKDLGIRVPGGTAAVLFSLVRLRARLKMRGVGFVERREDQLPQEIRDRIDACNGAALGFGLADPAEGLVYQNQGLLLALDAGEPRRVARGLAMEAAFVAVAGLKGLGQAEVYFATAEQIAARHDDRTLLGTVAMTRAIAMLQVGRWRHCRDEAVQAVRYLGLESSESPWDLITARIYHLAAAGFLGDLREALELYHELLRYARDHGDLHSQTHVRLGMEVNAHLIVGDPDAAQRDVEGGIEAWTGRGFTLQHFYADRALVQIDLYRGRWDDAVRRATSLWTRFNRSTIRSVAICRALALEVLGRSLVAGPGAEERRLRRAARVAQRLNGEGPLWTRAHAMMLRAQEAQARGDQESAAVRFRQAAARYEEADMALHAAAARWRLARIMDPARGSRELEWAAQGVGEPELLLRTFAPGEPAARVSP
ncbi:MAG: AAA family ATPase [Pseudomonadota bacterium]